MADAPLDELLPKQGEKPSFQKQKALTVEIDRRLRLLGEGVGSVTDAGMAEIARTGVEFPAELETRIAAEVEPVVDSAVDAAIVAIDIPGQAEDAVDVAVTGLSLVKTTDKGVAEVKTFEDDSWAWGLATSGVIKRFLAGIAKSGGWWTMPGFNFSGGTQRTIVNDQYSVGTVAGGRILENALDTQGNVPLGTIQRWGARLAAAGTAALAFWPFQPKATTITKTIRQDGTGDFATIAAFEATISDSSVAKRYVGLLGPGVWTESKIFRNANYVTLRGVDQNLCRVVGYCNPDATDTVVADTSTFDLRGTEVHLENLTATIQNGRYVVHPELNGADADTVKSWENCTFEHLGNAEIDTWRAANPSQTGAGFDRVVAGGFAGGRIAVGEGTASGVVLTSRSTTYKGPSTYYLHDNAGFIKPARHKFEGDQFAGSAIVIIESIGAGLVSTNEFIGCRFDAERFILQDSGWKSSVVPQPAAHYDNRVVLRGCNPIGATFTGMRGRALRIVSNSTGSTSTVRVTGTAADAAMGMVRTRDGGGGLRGYAFGTRDISGITTASGTVLVNTLGKLLGDCSTVNKTLTVTVDGGAPVNIVFNTDLTAASNSTILGTINTALGSAATASEYAVDQGETYPRSHHEALLLNDGTAGIPRWGAVKYGSNRRSARLTAAADAASLFAGIALEPIPPGAYGRILRRGKLYAAAGAEGQIPGITALTSGDVVSLSATTDGRLEVGSGKPIGVASDNNILAFNAPE